MFESVPEQLSQAMLAQSNCVNIKDLYIVSKAFLQSLYLKERKHEIKTVTFLISVYMFVFPICSHFEKSDLSVCDIPCLREQYFQMTVGKLDGCLS